MITHVKVVTVYVGDQDRARAFYTETLGFAVTTDAPMEGGQRWLEVALPGGETRLALFTPPEQRDRIGTFSPVCFGTDDIQKTFEDLTARGVEFVQPPARQPWGGTMALFKDPDGNIFVIHD